MINRFKDELGLLRHPHSQEIISVFELSVRNFVNQRQCILETITKQEAENDFAGLAEQLNKLKEACEQFSQSLQATQEMLDKTEQTLFASIELYLTYEYISAKEDYLSLVSSL